MQRRGRPDERPPGTAHPRAAVESQVNDRGASSGPPDTQDAESADLRRPSNLIRIAPA